MSEDSAAPRLRSNSDATASERFGKAAVASVAEELREDVRVEAAEGGAESLVKLEGSDWFRRAPSRKI